MDVVSIILGVSWTFLGFLCIGLASRVGEGA